MGSAHRRVDERDTALIAASVPDENDEEWRETSLTPSSTSSSEGVSDDEMVRLSTGRRRRRGQSRGAAQARGRSRGNVNGTGLPKGRPRKYPSAVKTDKIVAMVELESKGDSGGEQAKGDVIIVEEWSDDGLSTPPLPGDSSRTVKVKVEDGDDHRRDEGTAAEEARLEDIAAQEEDGARVEDRWQKERRRAEEERRERSKREQEEEEALLREEQKMLEQLLSEGDDGDLSVCSDDDDYYERKRQERLRRNAKMLAFLNEDLPPSSPQTERPPSRVQASKGRVHSFRTFKDGTTTAIPRAGQTFELAYIAIPVLRERSRSSYIHWHDPLPEPDEGHKPTKNAISPEPAKGVSPGPPRGFRKGPAGDGLDGDGTSCHQCRRKTLDEKMRCRNHENGQVCPLFYCRRCLRKRYGIVDEWDPESRDWKCPRCLAYCNCSLCLLRAGLGHYIRPNQFNSIFDDDGRQKFPSVKHFLDSLSPDGALKIGPGGICAADSSRKRKGKRKKPEPATDTQAEREDDNDGAIVEKLTGSRGRPKRTAASLSSSNLAAQPSRPTKRRKITVKVNRLPRKTEVKKRKDRVVRGNGSVLAGTKEDADVAAAPPKHEKDDAELGNLSSDLSDLTDSEDESQHLPGQDRGDEPGGLNTSLNALFHVPTLAMDGNSSTTSFSPWRLNQPEVNAVPYPGEHPWRPPMSPLDENTSSLQRPCSSDPMQVDSGSGYDEPANGSGIMALGALEHLTSADLF